MIRKEINAEVIRPLLNEPKLDSTRLLNCPRCDSTKTKFRYYNNNCKTQPRYICLDCKRYWTEGGTIRYASTEGHKEKRASLEPSLSLEQPAKAQKKLESLPSTSFFEHPENGARSSVFVNHPIKYQVSQPPLHQHAKAQKKAETLLLRSSLEQPVKVASLPFSENGHIITLQAKHQASQPPLQQQQPAKGQQKAITLSSCLELPEKAAPLSFLESQVSQPPLEQPSKAQEKGEFLSSPSYLKQSHEFAPLSFSKDFHICEPQARHQVSQSPLEQLAKAAFSKGLSSSATYQGNHLPSSCQRPYEILKCPYCNSSDTKLRIYKNHSKQQPRHFCRSCKQLRKASGNLRNANVDECAREDKNEMISNVSSPSLKQNGSENETQCLSLSLSLSPSLEQSGRQVGENALVSFSFSLEQARDHKHKIMSVHSQKVKPFPSKERQIQDTKSLSLSLSLSPSLEQSRGQNNEKALVVFSPLLQQGGDQRDKRGSAPCSSSLEHSQKIDTSSLDACHAKHLTSGSSLPNEIITCPRCCSSDTKFRYYNNNNKGQPRYICKDCKRYFTEGGALRNAYAGGSMKENKSHKQKAGTMQSSSLEAACNSLFMANLSNPPLQFPES